MKLFNRKKKDNKGAKMQLVRQIGSLTTASEDLQGLFAKQLHIASYPATPDRLVVAATKQEKKKS